VSFFGVASSAAEDEEESEEEDDPQALVASATTTAPTIQRGLVKAIVPSVLHRGEHGARGHQHDAHRDHEPSRHHLTHS
jgi:hypothetical protein